MNLKEPFDIDIEQGVVHNETGIDGENPYKTKTDEKMGINPATLYSVTNKDSVDQVDNNSNFVFSSFHDLNLFIILQLENRLIRARKDLYDHQGVPKEN